jgi:transcriptional regulator with XRE-family HTH domain
VSPEKFKEIRVKLGLTQKELADIFGIAKLSVSQYETGFRSPSIVIMAMMSLLNSLSEKKAKELLVLIEEHSKLVHKKLKRSKDD